MKAGISIAAAAMLAACATLSPADDPAVARLRRSYQAARALVTLFAPYLPPDRVARLRRLGEVVERALILAGSASDHAGALDRAAVAAAAYRHAAGQ